MVARACDQMRRCAGAAASGEDGAEVRCQDEGQHPDCLGEADERYTMDFSDVEPGAKIYWCARCGRWAHEIDKVLVEKLHADPNFADKLEKAMVQIAMERRN